LRRVSIGVSFRGLKVAPEASIPKLSPPPMPAVSRPESMKPIGTNSAEELGFIRNHQIVQASEGMIAFWSGSSRGTAHAIRLARRHKLCLRVYDDEGNIVPESRLSRD